jgi:hypothetical protein
MMISPRRSGHGGTQDPQVAVINKSKRMVDIVSLGDLSHSAPGDVLSKYVKSVSEHRH